MSIMAGSSDTYSHEKTPLLSTSSFEIRTPDSYPAPSYFAAPSPREGGTVRFEEEDNYIVSLIRRTSTIYHDYSSINNEDRIKASKKSGGAPGKASQSSPSSSEGTTWGQTVVNLVKGYVGCGILTLPWAISQLGLPIGLLGILFMSVWTSYNCWTVAKLKQYIERNNCFEEGDSDDGSESDATSCRMSGSMAETSVGSNSTTRTTYPDVGEWAYGAKFQSCVAFCICAQQLAICTVFVSFVGENLVAALRFWNLEAADLGREAVTVLSLPVFLLLSCGMPTVKSMVPLMILGTLLMLSGFGLLGWIGLLKWDDRLGFDEIPELRLDGNAVMALCGILYSFEGICIILPVESSMSRPTLEFRSAFGFSMMVVTILMCGMAGLGVLVFGEVTNGSITAFLLEKYGDEESDLGISSKIVLCNLLVSLSIVFTYPLMLYPAVELIAPSIFDCGQKRRGNHRTNPSTCCYRGENIGEDEDSLGFATTGANRLEGFEPMGGIPEDGEPSIQTLPSLQDHDETEATASLQMQNNTDAETIRSGEATDGGGLSESASLLSRLSSISYQQSIVESTDSDDDEGDKKGVPSPQKKMKSRGDDFAFDWILPGDSVMLRGGLVLATFLVAILVPNVQSLVSLVGAVTGSSTALLIPPILKLAYIRHIEAKEDRLFGSSLMGDWEGGPSIAAKQMLFGHSLNHSHRQKKRRWSKYLSDRLLSWFLLILGLAFALIGSYFSVQDILQSYMSESEMDNLYLAMDNLELVSHSSIDKLELVANSTLYNLESFNYTMDNLESVAHSSMENFKSGANSTMDNLKSAAHSTMDSVKSGANSTMYNLKSGTHSTMDKLESAAHSTVDSVKSGANSTMYNLKSGTHSTMDKLESAAHSTVDSVKSAANSSLYGVKSGVHSAMASVKSAANSTVDKLESAAYSTVDSMKSGAHNFELGVHSSMENLNSGANSTIYDLKSGAHSTMDKLESGAHSAMDSVKSGAHYTVDSVKSGAHNFESGAHSTMENLKSGFHSTMDKLESGAHSTIDSMKSGAHYIMDSIRSIAHSIAMTFRSWVGSAEPTD